MVGAGLVFNKNWQEFKISQLRSIHWPYYHLRMRRKERTECTFSIKETSIIDLEVHQDIRLRSRLCFQWMFNVNTEHKTSLSQPAVLDNFHPSWVRSKFSKFLLVQPWKTHLVVVVVVVVVVDMINIVMSRSGPASGGRENINTEIIKHILFNIQQGHWWPEGSLYIIVCFKTSKW